MVDMTSGSIGREVADIHAVREALAAREEVDGERIAVAGFCQGGGFALIAGTRPGFSAAAVNYGAVPSKRAKLDGVCPVVAGYGARDRLFGRAMAERLEDHLSALGVPHDVKIYDGAGHSFFSKVEGGWQGWLARLPSPMAVGYERAGRRGRLAAHARVLRRARLRRPPGREARVGAAACAGAPVSFLHALDEADHVTLGVGEQRDRRPVGHVHRLLDRLAARAAAIFSSAAEGSSTST